MLFSERQLDKILCDLKRSGISSPLLQQDVLDHICCIMEIKIENGTDYETAYNEAMREFGSLKSIQMATTKAVEEVNKWSVLSLLNYFLTFLYLLAGIFMFFFPPVLLLVSLNVIGFLVCTPLAIAGYYICFTRIDFKKFDLIPYN